MEATTSAVEDSLVHSLDFKIKPGASYITGRRNCSFFASGGNTYAPNGVKVLRFQLSSDGWLDPSSVRIMYTLVNKSLIAGQLLRPLGSPSSFFRRLVIRCGGTTIEDCNDWDRVSHMFEILSTNEHLKDSEIEGFGFPIYRDGMPIMSGDPTRGIPPDSSKTVLFKPLSGLFMQEKMLPLRYCNIVIELEVVNNLEDPIVSARSQEAIPPGQNGTQYPAQIISIPPGTFSTSWEIQNAQIKCDILQIDSGLENSYAEYLLQGKTIPIPMSIFISQSQSLAQVSQETVNVTRSLTRLKALYITFLGDKVGDLRKEFLKPCNNFYSPLCNSTNANEVITLTHLDSGRDLYVDQGKNGSGATLDQNNFFTTRSFARSYNSTNELGYQIQLGSKLYPEMRTTSNSEAFYYLAKTLKQQNTIEHGFQIEPHAYYNHEFIIGQNFEKVEGASFTGINTKMGDLMTIKLFNNSPVPAIMPTKIFVTLVGDLIMNIGDTGIQVFD